MVIVCFPLGFMTSLGIECCLGLQYRTWTHGFSPIDLTSDIIRKTLVSPPTQSRGTTHYFAIGNIFLGQSFLYSYAL